VKTNYKTSIVAIFFLIHSCLSLGGELPVSSPEELGMSSEKLARATSSVQGLIDDENSGGKYYCGSGGKNRYVREPGDDGQESEEAHAEGYDLSYLFHDQTHHERSSYDAV
jgi:hypothetical protein